MLYSLGKGGGRGLPEKILMQMVNFYPIFADYLLIFPPKLCVIFAFKAPISGIRDVGDLFPFTWGEGCPPRVFFFFFEKRMQMIHSESIHSPLVVGIFLNFTFVMKAALCRVCDAVVFP